MKYGSSGKYKKGMALSQNIDLVLKKPQKSTNKQPYKYIVPVNKIDLTPKVSATPNPKDRPNFTNNIETSSTTSQRKSSSGDSNFASDFSVNTNNVASGESHGLTFEEFKILQSELILSIKESKTVKDMLDFKKNFIKIKPYCKYY